MSWRLLRYMNRRRMATIPSHVCPCKALLVLVLTHRVAAHLLQKPPRWLWHWFSPRLPVNYVCVKPQVRQQGMMAEDVMVGMLLLIKDLSTFVVRRLKSLSSFLWFSFIFLLPPGACGIVGVKYLAVSAEMLNMLLSLFFVSIKGLTRTASFKNYDCVSCFSAYTPGTKLEHAKEKIRVQTVKLRFFFESVPRK